MLPALGGKHIFEGQPIAFFIKNINFWTPQRREKEPCTSLCSLLSLLCPFGSVFFRSMGLLKNLLSPECRAFFASRGPTGKKKTYTTAFNLRIAPTILCFSSAPPCLSNFFYNFCSLF